MAGQAPEPVTAMIDLFHMPCSQLAGFGIGIPFLVAIRAFIEIRCILAWQDRERGGIGIRMNNSGLLRISLPGTGDARCDKRDYHRKPSQHDSAPPRVFRCLNKAMC